MNVSGGRKNFTFYEAGFSAPPEDLEWVAV
jgi:hypothetical protein